VVELLFDGLFEEVFDGVFDGVFEGVFEGVFDGVDALDEFPPRPLLKPLLKPRVATVLVGADPDPGSTGVTDPPLDPRLGVPPAGLPRLVEPVVVPAPFGAVPP